MSLASKFLVPVSEACLHFGITPGALRALAEEGRILTEGPVGMANTSYDLDSYRDSPDLPARGIKERTTYYAMKGKAAESVNLTVPMFEKWWKTHEVRTVKVGSQKTRLVEWSPEMERIRRAKGKPWPCTRPEPSRETLAEFAGEPAVKSPDKDDESETELDTPETTEKWVIMKVALAYFRIVKHEIYEFNKDGCINMKSTGRAKVKVYFDLSSMRPAAGQPTIPYNPDTKWRSLNETLKHYDIMRCTFEEWHRRGYVQVTTFGGKLARYNVASFNPTEADKSLTPQILSEPTPPRSSETTTDLPGTRRINVPTTLEEAQSQLASSKHTIYYERYQHNRFKSEYELCLVRMEEEETARIKAEKLVLEERIAFEVWKREHADRRAVLANPALRGAIGEKEFHPILDKSHFKLLGEIVHTGKKDHCADFNQVGRGFTILHELKNWNTTVKTKEVEKLYRDIAEVELQSGIPCIGATFVSWHSTIDKMHGRIITELHNNHTLIVFVNHMDECGDCVEVLNQAHERIINHQKTARKNLYSRAATALILKQTFDVDLMIQWISSEALGVKTDSTMATYIQRMAKKMVSDATINKDKSFLDIFQTIDEMINTLVTSEMLNGIIVDGEVIFSPLIVRQGRARSTSRDRSRSASAPRGVHIAEVVTASDGSATRMSVDEVD